MDPITLALALAAGIVGKLPEPDPVIRRAQYVRRLTATVVRLERRAHRTPVQEGRLEGARAALRVLADTDHDTDTEAG